MQVQGLLCTFTKQTTQHKKILFCLCKKKWAILYFPTALRFPTLVVYHFLGSKLLLLQQRFRSTGLSSSFLNFQQCIQNKPYNKVTQCSTTPVTIALLPHGQKFLGKDFFQKDPKFSHKSETQLTVLIRKEGAWRMTIEVSVVDRIGNKYRASAARKNAGTSPKNLTR